MPSPTHTVSVGRAQLLADFDAFDIMLDRLLPRGLHRRGERACGVTVRLPRLILKGVGVDRIKAKAEARGLLLQRGDNR